MLKLSEAKFIKKNCKKIIVDDDDTNSLFEVHNNYVTSTCDDVEDGQV